MESKNSLESRLRAAGRRMTPQRKLILSILDETGDHLDAEEVYRSCLLYTSDAADE